jgi:prepilin-type N-terminal cleavage/methylation domain-containing protein
VRAHGKDGFTLVELLTVVLILGILAAFAIPSYTRAVATSQAKEAAALVEAVSRANQMYKVDYKTYARGMITNQCNTRTCPTTDVQDACALVACKYLAAQDWDAKPYTISAVNGMSILAIISNAQPTQAIAGARWRTPIDGNLWGYTVSSAQLGKVSASNGAPNP